MIVHVRFLAQPRVLHCDVLLGGSSLEGRQTGLTKSEKVVTGLSNFTRTVVPSTGDLIIPTILRSCSQGDVLESRTTPSRADHSAFGCLFKK